MAKRKASMTNRQRVEALLQHEKPDRVPIWPFAAGGFCCVHTRTSIADAYNKPDVSTAAQRKTAEDFGWVYAPMIAYAAMGAWELGGEIKWPSGEFAQAPMITRRPVESVDDVWNLKVPDDVSTVGIVPLMMEVARIGAQEDLDNKPFKVFGMAGGAFTRAGNMCGPETLCKWLIKKPEAAHHMLQVATDFVIALAAYWKQSFGTEGILLMAASEASTANELISARQFEEFALPYDQKIAQAVLGMGFKHIYTHICGEQNENLPHWQKIDFGQPGIISFGHEIELADMARHFPDDIILGNLEPAVIQTKTPDEVYEATKKNIQDGMSLSNGYIFSPGCELPPKSPPDNIMAMTKAVEDYGWYD